MRILKTILLFSLLFYLLAGCASSMAPPMPEKSAGSPLKVVAAETFLADIAQNVAGERLQVEPLMPIGVDPHGFEPTPPEVARVADSNVLIVNGAGFEEFLDELLQNAGGERLVIEAAAGLVKRSPQEGEAMEHADEEGDEHAAESDSAHAVEAERKEEHHHHDGDPHFWFDPTLVIKYVENIRVGLSKADPDGAAVYAANADKYIAQLRELDQWIAEHVKQVPQERRLLVTNHESLGYFADRYGFKVVGTIVPNVSPTSSPSAGQLAELVTHIKATGAPAIFLETGTNPQLANQIAKETGIKVETNLYSHSITEPGGAAPTYIDMMRYNTRAIVEALK